MDRPLFLYFVLGILCLTSCSRQFDLKEDLVLNEVFAVDEISEVQRIIDFVDDRVVKVTGQDDVDKAYHACLREINENGGGYELMNRIFSPEEKAQLKACLSPSVANAFWIPEEINPTLIFTRNNSVNRLEYSSWSINPIGRFQAYLKKKGETNYYYRNLYLSILKNGDLSIADAKWFSCHHREFDFEEPQARLWGAIYLLRVSQSEQMTRL